MARSLAGGPCALQASAKMLEQKWLRTVLVCSPCPAKLNLRGQSDDIWGARGPQFRPILGVPGARAGLKNIYVLALCDGHHVNAVVRGSPDREGSSVLDVDLVVGHGIGSLETSGRAPNPMNL